MNRWRASLLTGAAGLLPLLLAGCHPTGAWLPDSSGFVYSEPDDRDSYAVIHYDLKSKKKNILVKGLKGRTSNAVSLGVSGSPVPAVSPDGKQVAVARVLVKNQQPSELEISLYDFTGKPGRQLKTLPFGAPQNMGSGTLIPEFMFWFPDGKHILVMVSGSRSAVYDLDKEEVTLHDFVPAAQIPFVRPDGKGFVGTVGDVGKSGGKGGLVLVDWDGKVTPVDRAFNPLALDPVGVRWGKGQLLLEGPQRLVAIDLASGRLERKEQKFDPDIGVGEKVVFLPFGDGTTTTRLGLVSREPKSALIPDPFKLTDIVVYGPGGKKTVVAEGEIVFPLFPSFSPDGSLAVIRLDNRLLVVRNTGAVVAEVESSSKKP